MPLTVLILSFLAASGQVEPPAVSNSRPIVVTGRGGVPFIAPMGQAIRARSPNEDTLARWFAEVDSNRDGYLTPDELQADAVRYFEALDTNHDGQIDPDELVRYEWQVAPEIQVNSRLRKARAPGEQAKADEDDKAGKRPNSSEDEGDRSKRGLGYAEQGLQGAARYGLLNLPEPVAAADLDLNRAISLSEFKQAALDRFQLLDTKHQGRISLQDLEIIRAAALSDKKSKRRSEQADTRVGVPLPPGN